MTLGGPGGRDVELEKGEVVVLPAGTGHCLIEAYRGLQVAGAYPQGQEWDILRDAADPATLGRIASVPWPDSDPLEGAEGALPHLWTRP